MSYKGVVDSKDDALPLLMRYWWISLARGVLAFSLGVAVLFSEQGKAQLANYMALYWLLGGALTVQFSLAGRWRPGSRLGLIAGIAGIVLAVVTLTRAWLRLPAAEAVRIVGAVTALMGSLRVFGAFVLEERTGQRWTFGGTVLGVLEIALGLMLMAHDQIGTDALFAGVAVWGLTAGSLLVVDGLRFRRLVGNAMHRGER